MGKRAKGCSNCVNGWNVVFTAATDKIPSSICSIPCPFCNRAMAERAAEREAKAKR